MGAGCLASRDGRLYQQYPGIALPMLIASASSGRRLSLYLSGGFDSNCYGIGILRRVLVERVIKRLWICSL